VNVRSKKLLAGTSLAEQQDRRVSRGHELQLFQDAADCLTLANDGLGAGASLAVSMRPDDPYVGKFATPLADARLCRTAMNVSGTCHVHRHASPLKHRRPGEATPKGSVGGL
jgi:hypothetical protein